MSKHCWICWVVVMMSITSPVMDGRAGPLGGKIPAKPTPELPEFKPKTAPKGFTLPKVPDAVRRLPSAPVLILKGVLFEGNTVFPDQVLAQVAAPFLNRLVSMADLEELRHGLTRFYIDKGYVNSGALIKDGQTVKDGRLIFRIIEGRLTTVKVRGNGRLRPDYIRGRIWPDPDRPFNTLNLQERFQMLLRDPLIRQMDGRIMPGETPGQGVLALDITRERPYELSLGVDNHSSPSIGSEQATAQAVLRNLTGYADALHLNFGHTRGDDEITAFVSFPLNRYDTQITAGISRSANEVVEAPLKGIDVESRLTKRWIEISHPVYQSLDFRFDLGLTFETQESRTYLLETPFSFSKGYESGKARMSVVRLVQSLQYRSRYQAFVVRSSVNLGLDMCGATVHSQDLPDSEFLSWLGQAQYAVRLGDRLGQLMVKGFTQLANEPLLSMEQLSLGGAATVRGYRENQVVRDNGAGLSLEWQIPVWNGKPDPNGVARQLLAAPFIDYGKAWNKGQPSLGDALWSAGIGLVWRGPRVDAQVYWGHGFTHVLARPEHNLQDDGLHFQIKVKVL